MAWIKFEKDLITDPRVLRIARSLQANWSNTPALQGCNAPPFDAVTLVCGALVRIWSLADTHLGSDDILPLGIDEIDQVIGIPGFCALMPPDWLIPLDDKTVQLPEFLKHNGIEAKKKASVQKRVERLRKRRNASALQRVTPTALPDPDQDQTKKRPSDKAHHNGAAIDRLLELGVERQAAEDWLAVRKAKRAPLTESVLNGLAKQADIAGISVAQAVAICARKSWQGFDATWNWQDTAGQIDYAALAARIPD